MLITLVSASVTCLVAVVVARRWQLQLVPAWLASLGWGGSLWVAFLTTFAARPPIPWTTTALEAEPWESVVYPTWVVCLIWPLLYDRCARWSELRLLVLLGLASLPLLAALCQAERFAAQIVGNPVWAIASLLAVGANWMAMCQLNASGAGRWSLWIVVGQMVAVAAMIMTCYGRFGEWATLAGLALTGCALARVLVPTSDSPWSDCLSLPALTLNCVLLMHMREYRSTPLPVWFLPLPFLLPTIVWGVDALGPYRFKAPWRVIIAALLTGVLSASIVAIVLLLNGPSEEW